ncbi:AraC family transcriptional regulator [Paenibacillus mesophilus]|uniref:AraC family transcriptional regulator n=1 Tax=Paenibacillus mesophilus TaxID=2582849 RepID=UPI0013051455|nr:AraC family transcriptional regulator [Paenibacillus mesophilus]
MHAPAVIKSFFYRNDCRTIPYLHEHDCFVIYYVHTGSCCYYNGSELYGLEPGDLLISNGNVRNGTMMTQPCTRTNIQFFASNVHTMLPTSVSVDVMAPFRKRRTCRWKLGSERTAEIESIFSKMLGCRHRTDPVSVNRFHNAFVDLLLLICEISDEPLGQSSELSKVKEAHVQRIISYIGDHYGDELTLDHLAGCVNLNKHYVAKLFKETMGMTVFDYIKKRRVLEAKQLLTSDKDKSVTDIGLDVGFKQLSHFSASFKQITGLSPEQFRKRQIVGTFPDGEVPL